MSKADPDRPTEKRPLRGLHNRLKIWLRQERDHWHQVRMKTLTQRMIFELEYERAQQLVLPEHNAKTFFAPTLKSRRQKLSLLRAIGPCNRQKQCFARNASPNINVSTRMLSRLADKQQQFDDDKHATSWQTVD